MASFAELIATAVSNATTRSELIASRARIVTAGDEARRRIERNLHDGMQQRLVALGLDMQAVAASMPEDEARSGLERIGREIEAVLEDVRELSRGLHPALLSQAGLEPSLRALARKSPIPVTLAVSVTERPSESIEIAVYYVISEALANAAKHANASEISVELATSADGIRARIEDDGIGGAEASGGSGLIGLIDRVEALGGRFAFDSPPGHGTTISVELPLTAESIGDAVRARVRSRSADDEGLLRPAERSQPTDAATLFAAVAASADALYIVDALGRIKFLNPAALRILGYADDRQLLGRASHDTIHYLRGDGTPSRLRSARCCAHASAVRPSEWKTTGSSVRTDHSFPWHIRLPLFPCRRDSARSWRSARGLSLKGRKSPLRNRRATRSSSLCSACRGGSRRRPRIEAFGCTLDGALVEEVRHRVRDPRLGSVRFAHYRGGLEDVPERELVSDDQRDGFLPREEADQSVRVTANRLVQAFTTREALAARVPLLPRPVGLDRSSVEDSGPDFIEVSLDDDRDIPTLQRKVKRLPSPREPRADREIDLDVGDLRTEL